MAAASRVRAVVLGVGCVAAESGELLQTSALGREECRPRSLFRTTSKYWSMSASAHVSKSRPRFDKCRVLLKIPAGKLYIHLDLNPPLDSLHFLIDCNYLSDCSRQSRESFIDALHRDLIRASFQETCQCVANLSATAAVTLHRHQIYRPELHNITIVPTLYYTTPS